jgi:DNA-binding FadR family transcriptional regulator
MRHVVPEDRTMCRSRLPPLDLRQGLNRLNLAETVARQLGEAIVTGKYAVGETLPKESMLGDAFSVSRSVVREAIKILSVKGFLAARPKRGTWVRPQSAWNLFDADAFLWLCKTRSTREVLVQSFELRLTVEPPSAALAAIAASEAHLLDLQASLFAIEGSGAMESSDIMAFHRLVLVASGNLFFAQLANFIELVIGAAARNYCLNSEVPYRCYEEVANAIIERSPAGAEISMRLLLQAQKDSMGNHASSQAPIRQGIALSRSRKPTG